MNPSSRPRSLLARLCVALLVAGLAAGGTSTASAGPADGVAGRGQVLWLQPLRTLDVDGARTTLRRAGFDASSARFGAAEYRVVYRTVDPRGAATTASGLLAVPDRRDRPLRLVSFAHGTASYRGDAPSSAPADDLAAAPALQFAAAGLLAAAPDYLGLGLGPGSHPYFDIGSETTASVDLLRAALAVAASLGHTVLPGVDVSGFSQGASAATALGRALQGGADRRLSLHALAAISGGYDFADVELPALLGGRVPGPIAVAYVAYLLVATDRLHRLYGDPAEVFRAPYASRVDTLFGGDVPGPQMLAALPQSLDALLTPRGLQLLRHPSGRFAQVLATIDGTCDWRPAAPVRLLYARGDEQAVTGNTASCARDFAAAGVRVPTTDVGPVDLAGSRHLGSAVAGSAVALRWLLALG